LKIAPVRLLLKRKWQKALKYIGHNGLLSSLKAKKLNPKTDAAS
jgi:hypothetical protein